MDDVRAHDMDGLLVGTSQWDNQVGITLGGLDEFLVHGLEYLAVTVYYHLGSASTLYEVALNNSDKAFVGVGINKDF